MTTDHWRGGARKASLWQLLVWAYHHQKVHRYLETPFQWFIYELSALGVIEDMPRPTVHADAAAIHRVVCGMAAADREIVSLCAALAEMPELPDGEPRPYPMTAEKATGEHVDEWFAWHEEPNGRRLRYLVRVAERVQLRKVPVMRKAKGKRGRMQVVGFKPVLADVEYCPLAWDPDPFYFDALRAIYADWLDAMVRLYAAMSTVRLKDHELGPVGIDAAVDAETIYKSMIGPPRASDGTVKVEVELLAGRRASLDGSTLNAKLWARAQVDRQA